VSERKCFESGGRWEVISRRISGGRVLSWPMTVVKSFELCWNQVNREGYDAY
jgi:hypothetical protein